MVKTNESTVYLANMMVLCISPFLVRPFEGVDCLPQQIITAKCEKCNESLSLENTNNLEIFVVHIDANKIKVMSNFSDKL